MREDKAPRRPNEFSDTATWAAWLYYVDELTQKKVADRLKISRVTVIKLLAEARERGIVKVTINTEVAASVKISKQLAAKYDLDEALVIPSLSGEDLLQRLGNAASMILMDKLQDGETLAVAWGRTVSAVADAVPSHNHFKNITVAQLVASPDGLASDFSPELCSSLLANQLSAKCVNILAPVVVSSPEIRASLMKEPSIAAQFNIIRGASIALFGTGELGAGSTLETHNLYAKDIIEDVKSKGAAAVIMGLFIDENGDEVRSKIHDQMICASLNDLKAMQKRICVAGGLHKVKAIRAALRAKLITHLVTDEDTASQLLKS
ncbi:MAG: sugar-binding transcriptional regulator [Hyphomicrobiales bacterium]